MQSANEYQIPLRGKKIYTKINEKISTLSKQTTYRLWYFKNRCNLISKQHYKFSSMQQNDEIDNTVQLLKDCLSFNNRLNPRIEFNELSFVNHLYSYAD